jgi:hypothetical protein
MSNLTLNVPSEDPFVIDTLDAMAKDKSCISDRVPTTASLLIIRSPAASNIAKSYEVVSDGGITLTLCARDQMFEMLPVPDPEVTVILSCLTCSLPGVVIVSETQGVDQAPLVSCRRYPLGKVVNEQNHACGRVKASCCRTYFVSDLAVPWNTHVSFVIA